MMSFWSLPLSNPFYGSVRMVIFALPVRSARLAIAFPS